MAEGSPVSEDPREEGEVLPSAPFLGVGRVRGGRGSSCWFDDTGGMVNLTVASSEMEAQQEWAEKRTAYQEVTQHWETRVKGFPVKRSSWKGRRACRGGLVGRDTEWGTERGGRGRVRWVRGSSWWCSLGGGREEEEEGFHPWFLFFNKSMRQGH